VDILVRSLHLIAAAVWAGGLVFLGLAAGVARATIPERERVEFFRMLGRRFLWVTAAAAVLLALTGVHLARDEIPGWSLFTDSSQAHLILAKTILFASALGLAALHSFVLGPRVRRVRERLLDAPDDPKASAELRRASAVSGIVSAVMLAETVAILVLAADLVA
jgi:putative copper export protein